MKNYEAYLVQYPTGTISFQNQIPRDRKVKYLKVDLIVLRNELALFRTSLKARDDIEEYGKIRKTGRN